VYGRLIDRKKKFWLEMQQRILAQQPCSDERRERFHAQWLFSCVLTPRLAGGTA
jgi:hypothetical protein